MKKTPLDQPRPVDVNCMIKPPRAWRELFGQHLALLLFGIVTLVGAGCKVAAPKQEIENTVHAREDLAVTDQQVRIRMRALVEPLSGAIVESADRIMAGTTNRSVRRAALVWKIEAVPALREALFRPNPFVATMDTWVLTLQMREYFESGPGGETIGDAAPVAIETCRALSAEVERIAASMVKSGDVSDARAFAEKWAAEHPVRHSIASRESTLSRVTERDIQEAFSTQELAGNAMVTLDDLNRRMGILSTQLFDQARWQAELFAMDQAADYQLEKAMPMAETAVQSATDAVKVMEKLAPAVEDALAVAKSSPELVSRERVAAIEAAQKEISRTLEFVQAERIAALEELHRTIVKERELLTADVEQISLKVVDHALLRVAQLTGAILLAVFFGIIVLLFIARRLFSRN